MKLHRIAITASLFTILSTGSVLADEAKPVAPDDALAKLQAGNERFATSKVTEGRPVAAKRVPTLSNARRSSPAGACPWTSPSRCRR